MKIMRPSTFVLAAALAAAPALADPPRGGPARSAEARGLPAPAGSERRGEDRDPRPRDAGAARAGADAREKVRDLVRKDARPLGDAEKALVKRHLKVVARLQRVIASAEKHHNPKAAERARALLKRADEAMLAKLTALRAADGGAPKAGAR